MRRREFLFRTAQAALLFAPIFSIRRAEAQALTPRKRALFSVFSAGYPDPSDFFPSGGELDFALPVMLAPLEALKPNMVVVDGVDLRDSGLNPAGANHARSVGKVLTAKDMLPSPDEEGYPGDVSIDQYIAQQLNLSSVEMIVGEESKDSMRFRPFASGPGVFKPPFWRPVDAWDRVFQNFVPPTDEGPAREARLRRLRARRSLLDGLGEDLKRLRQELAGIEKHKLDVHEDAIRKAELSVLADLENVPPPSLQCQVPARDAPDVDVPSQAKAHLDVLFAALTCDRVQVGSVLWGGSGYGWRYNWLPGTDVSDLHNDVHHLEGPQRETYARTASWDWKTFGGLIQRLRDTPEGAGNMLDHTIALGIGHFSHHHDIRRLPVVLFGTSTGGLATGRYLKLPQPVDNDQLLTSVARLMGLPVSGFGDNPGCGPLPLL